MFVLGSLDREQCSVREANQRFGGGCVTSHWISVLLWAFQPGVSHPSHATVEEGDEYPPHPLQ